MGDKRGRTIGFPTANVLADPALVVPARGVYAGFVRVGKDTYAACTNIGVAPTFERRESRGGHFRDDHPSMDPEWATLNVQVSRRADGTMQVRRIPIPPMPAELKQIIDEMK